MINFYCLSIKENKESANYYFDRTGIRNQFMWHR